MPENKWWFILVICIMFCVFAEIIVNKIIEFNCQCKEPCCESSGKENGECEGEECKGMMGHE